MMECKTLTWRLVSILVAVAMLVPTTWSVAPVPVVQAADTGWKSPEANWADTAAGDGDGFEQNPTYAYADDDNYAGNQDGADDSHHYFDFGLAIPADAVITGIEVYLKGGVDTVADSPQYEVDLSWNQGQEGSWSSTRSASLGGTLGLDDHVLGGQSDLWGEHAWSVDDFSDTNFRVRITSRATGSGSENRDFYLDWVGVRVHYIEPAIQISKTPDSQMVRSGSTADFTIVVTNTGDVTLTNVTVTDALAPDCGATLGSLAPTQSASYPCSLANVTADFTNSATATGTPPVGSDVSDTDTALVDVIHPAIEIAKTPDSQMVRYGSTANFTIVVTNIGDVTLTDVTVTDALAPYCDATLGSLTPTESASYSCSRANVTADFTNSATATGTPPVGSDVSDSDTALVDVIHPAIEIAKTPDSQMVRSGSTADFTIVVTNTGDVTLADVTVTDALAPDCDATLGSLAPTQSASYSCSQANVTADFTNSATATGTPPVGSDVSDSDTALVDVIHPAIEIAKTPDSQMVRYGSTVTFTVAVTNTGDVPLTDVTVTDAQAPDCGQAVGALGIGDSYATTCSHPNVTADFSNTAIVTGTPPVGPSVGDTDTAFVDVISPSIEIAKTPDTQMVDRNSTVVFTISVTNTGDVALTNVMVSDPQAPDCSEIVGDLTVGDDHTYTCAVINVTSDLTNTATVTGTPPVGPDVRDLDTAFVDVINPSIEIAKTPDSQIVSHNSTATFTIAVTNTGDVPLTNVVVSDALAPNCARTVGALTVGDNQVYTCTLANVTNDFINTAIVTGTPPVGPDVSDFDVAFVDVVNPYIRIVKTPDVQVVRNGSTATFTITVVNTSDTTLSNVIVSDPQSPNCARAVGTLAAGNDHTYTCTVAGVTDDFINNATVTGTPPVGPDVSDSDIAFVNVIDPHIQIAKMPDTQTVRPNATVTFTIAVINTGDVPLTDVIVRDDLAPNCSALPGTLAVSENWQHICTVTGVITDFTNTAIVTGTPSVGDDVTDTDTAFVDVIAPAIEISKTPDTQTVTSGSIAIFTILVTNTGDTSLADVTISDALTPDCNRSLGDLDAGEDASYECARANVTSDFTNSATVTGWPVDGKVVNDTDTAAVHVTVPDPPGSLYLPLVMQSSVIAPDLVVEHVVATRHNVQVTIKNQGNVPVLQQDPFWIDLYVDPHPVPTAVNQTWYDLCQWGIVWGIEGPALPLAPGGSVTLTIGDDYYSPEYSKFPALLPVGTPIYVQVDSANVNTTYGAVLEDHEISGEPYNNITGPVFSTGSGDSRGGVARGE
jgi:uncharacterized repeat protein (TIGR01451 family)